MMNERMNELIDDDDDNHYIVHKGFLSKRFSFCSAKQNVHLLKPHRFSLLKLTHR